MFKHHFPLLQQKITYLDSAATAQKPQVVIDAMVRFMQQDYANVNRGIYSVAMRASAAFAAARAKIASFIGAARAEEIVFVRGATEAINLVAASWAAHNVNAGDEIIITQLEHHANIVPWQMLAKQTGAVIKVAPLQADGSVHVADVTALFTPRTKLLAFAHVSNVLGTALPVQELCAAARAVGVTTLVDGCQAAPHLKLNMQQLGCDFYVFSGHKLYGPTGIGVLFGRYDLLASMPPYQTGGDMIERVSLTHGTTFKPPPQRFEAGTQAVVEVVGLAAAIDFIEHLGFDKIIAHEQNLLRLATAELQRLPDVAIYGTAQHKEPIITFSMAGMAAYDIATIADQMGVCLRVGQHCAEPLHQWLGVPATLRVSFGMYNEPEDVMALVAALNKAQKMLAA